MIVLWSNRFWSSAGRFRVSTHQDTRAVWTRTKTWQALDFRVIVLAIFTFLKTGHLCELPISSYPRYGSTKALLSAVWFFQRSWVGLDRGLEVGFRQRRWFFCVLVRFGNISFLSCVWGSVLASCLLVWNTNRSALLLQSELLET